ncbi:hypothetical protein HYALB_00007974 [Hymenoscyphus albidus]|uniref:BZIP transcription factor n=1 Tax=Hymenoscyphus albidus TaxID=595503 RepID=A0A9N9LK93_9HELO|nr:hypothetical protein HYALB_00007974 [Hymenoscyphus albidus]
MTCTNQFPPHITTYQRGEPIGVVAWSMSNDKIKLEYAKGAEEGKFEATEGAGDSSNSNSSKTEPRRRASRAGTRSVATLTEAQLARKRANDREAQRSIRQRTKDRIERLEQRIKDLTEGQNDERSFEEIQRRNEELEEELRLMREAIPQYDENSPYPNRSLRPDHLGIQMPPRPLYQVPWKMPNVSPGATALSTSYPTPGLNSVFSGSNYSLSNAGSPLSEMGSGSDYFGSFDVEPPQMSASSAGRSRPVIARSVSYPDPGQEQQAWSPGPFGFMGIDENLAGSNCVMSNNQNARARAMSTIPSSRPASASASSITPRPFMNSDHTHQHGSLSSSPVLSALKPSSMANGPHAGHQIPLSLSPVSSSAQSIVKGLQIPQQSPTNNHPSSNLSSKSSSPQSSSLPQPPNSFLNQPSLHPWELPLNLLPPTGPVDAILIGLLQRQRRLALEGVTGDELIGPPVPSVQALLHPTRSNEVHPVSSVISNLLQRTTLRGVPEKVAVLFLIYRITQWQISPSQETYNNLPDWFLPRSSQLVTRHPMWASQIIFGKLKDIVIHNQEVYATEEFQHIYSANVNVNWPYREQDVMTYVGDESRVADTFVEHICQFANWSLDEAFFRRYPELRGCCKVTGSMDTSS